MANTPASLVSRINLASAAFALLTAVVLLALPAHPLSAQQATPHIASVDPDSGKVNATITITGENLEKSRVSAVFLSDDKDDHKATVVSQAADKIVIKVPDVKPGGYNVSIQSGSEIYIQPVRFTVQ